MAQKKIDTYLSQDTQEQVYKIYQNQEKKMVKDKILITKRTYRLRECAKERRTWPKFGEVSEFQRGEHKKGDYIIGGTIKVETSQGVEEEIDIVKKLTSLTTDALKLRKEEKRQREQDIQAGDIVEEEDEFQEKKPLREATGASKLEQTFANMGHSSVSIKLEGLSCFELARTQKQQDDIKEEFRQFLADIIGEYSRISNNYKSRIPTKRRYDHEYYAVPPYQNRAFIEFQSEDKALKAIKLLNNQEFQSSYIEAEIAPNKKQ